MKVNVSKVLHKLSVFENNHFVEYPVQKYKNLFDQFVFYSLSRLKLRNEIISILFESIEKRSRDFSPIIISIVY